MNKKRKKKKQKDNNLFISIIITIVLALLSIIVIYFSQDNDELKKSLKKDGYKTNTVEDAFYKKITTGNTLDDYYHDISNEKNSKYEEYYLSKESFDFIEVKLNYNNKVSTSLNITSNLRETEIKYNYELSYQNTFLIIEGSSTENYKCNIIVSDNIGKSDISTYCDSIQEEIQVYLSRRNEVLNNEKVQELLSQPISSND